MNTQFKKGVLEMCVLALLVKREFYGYELVQEISKKMAISEGTIYPLLNRLKHDKFVSTYLQESTDGPPRKYYKLTDAGKKQLADFKQDWSGFVDIINKFLK